jgi:hypothetical protein
MKERTLLFSSPAQPTAPNPVSMLDRPACLGALHGSNVIAPARAPSPPSPTGSPCAALAVCLVYRPRHRPTLLKERDCLWNPTRDCDQPKISASALRHSASLPALCERLTHDVRTSGRHAGLLAVCRFAQANRKNLTAQISWVESSRCSLATGRPPFLRSGVA